MAAASDYRIPDELGRRLRVVKPFDNEVVAALIEHSQRRLSDFKRERQPYFEHWREVSTWLNPRRGKWVESAASKAKEGGKKHGAIINNSGSQAGRIAAAGLHTGLTPRSRPWFRMTTFNPAAARSSQARAWLQSVEMILREIFDRSNFYSTVRTDYRELVDFGTSAFSILPDYENVIRCRQHTIGSYYLGQDHRGVTNAFYEEYSLTVDQMLQRYEWENLSSAVQTLADNGRYDAWVPVVRCVEPNGPYYDPEGTGWERTPYRVLEFDKGDDISQALSIEPMPDFPVMVGLAERMGDEVYGSTSFGMEALGDAKELQSQMIRKARLIEQIGKPAHQAPTNLRGRMRKAPNPGEVIFTDEVQGAGGVRPIHVPDPRIQEIREDINDTERRIYNAYHRDVWQAISMVDRGNMREIEVDARIREQMSQLGPITEAQTERNDAIVGRVFRMAQRAGILPEAPQELQGEPLKADYISILAQAQKSQDIGAMREWAAASQMMKEMGFMIAGNMLHAEEWMTEFHAKIGAPPATLRDPAEANAMAQQEMQAAQAQQAAEVQATTAKAAKDASQAQVDDGNMLEAAIDAAAQQ